MIAVTLGFLLAACGEEKANPSEATGKTRDGSTEPAAQPDPYQSDKNSPKADTPMRFLGSVDLALQEVSERKLPYLLKFETTWCGPCKVMSHHVFPSKSVTDAAKGITCIVVDGDVHKELTKAHNVTGYPTGILFDANGTEIDRYVGYRTVEEMVAFFLGMPRRSGSMQSLLEIKTDPDDPLVRESALRQLLLEVAEADPQSEPAKVRELLDRILELDRTNGDALMARGGLSEELAENEPRSEVRAELYVSAGRDFALASQQPEFAYVANMRHGRMLVEQKNFTEALPRLKAALSERPSDNLAWYVRSVERAASGQDAGSGQSLKVSDP